MLNTFGVLLESIVRACGMEVVHNSILHLIAHCHDSDCEMDIAAMEKPQFRLMNMMSK